MQRKPWIWGVVLLALPMLNACHVAKDQQPETVNLQIPDRDTAGASHDKAHVREERHSKTEGTATIWPASLRPVGNGFPAVGDPCRKVGESEMTSDYLDDSATLVGCPTRAQANALIQNRKAKFMATVDGIVLISVPGG